MANGECDLLLTNNRLVDAKAWNPISWQNADEDKKSKMIGSIQTEINKYLGDPTGYTLHFEFRYAIPTRVLTVLQANANLPEYQGRLTWQANVDGQQGLS